MCKKHTAKSEATKLMLCFWDPAFC